MRKEPIDIPCLTGIRFLAALFVVVSHSAVSFVRFQGPDPLWHELLAQLAGVGMPLFFVLSGFVIHYNYSELIRTYPRRGIRTFFAARFARLYPLYLLMLCLDLFRFGYFETLDRPAVSHALESGLPYYLLLMQSWRYTIIGDHSLIFTFPAATQVTWSISTEWFFYLCYPLVSLAVARLRTVRAMTYAIIIVVLLGYASVCAADLMTPQIDAYATRIYGPIASNYSVDSFRVWLFYFSPYLRLFEFTLGALSAALFLALADAPMRKGEARWGAVATVGAVGAIGMVFYLLFGPECAISRACLLPASAILRQSYGFAPFVAVFLFCCARYPGRISALLSRPWIIACGEASYSIYLIHVIVVQHVGIFDLVAGVPPFINDFWGVMHATVTMVGVCMIVIGVSLVSYRVIEIPARRLIRVLLRVPRTARPAVSTVSVADGGKVSDL